MMTPEEAAICLRDLEHSTRRAQRLVEHCCTFQRKEREMNDMALHHTATYRAGEAGYYAPRPRGHLEVRHDSKRYLYDLRGTGYTAAEARAFVMQAWRCWRSRDVRGSYPVYEVEREA